MGIHLSTAVHTHRLKYRMGYNVLHWISREYECVYIALIAQNKHYNTPCIFGVLQLINEFFWSVSIYMYTHAHVQQAFIITLYKIIIPTSHASNGMYGCMLVWCI